MRRRVYLFGDIRSDTIKSCLEEMDSIILNFPDDTFDLIINSYGGCYSSCECFIRLLRERYINRVILTGECASGASVIWLSFPREKRYAYSDTQVCFHKARAEGTSGFSKALTNSGEVLKTYDDKMINRFAKESLLNNKEVEELFVEDVFKPVDYLVDIGLIDKYKVIKC